MNENSKINSIGKSIVLWMSGLVLCFVIIAISLLLSKSKLQSMNSQILADSIAVELAHRLETSILRERREDLLLRATDNDLYRQRENSRLQESVDALRQLSRDNNSPEERALMDGIERRFETFKIAATSKTPVSIEEISSLTNSLMQAVESFRELNREQMLETIEKSNRLNTLIDWWSLTLIIVVSLVVITVSMVLVSRIVHPTFDLIRTASKFGEGDFSVRTRVYRNDELGLLCKTFNDMAEAIDKLQQNRLNFIAAVSHDLKNPLIVVGAAARRLKTKALTLDEQSMWLDRIIERSGYIENLIDDLMDSVQIETGSLSLHMSELELLSFVGSVQRNHNELVTTHNIVLEGECECWINGDARRLERVILNIISNAIKYSPENSTVLLKVEKDESNAKIIVKDEGTGIKQDEIPELFMPFKRLSRTCDMVRGSGLGLFSAKKIVDGHGGTMNIFSESGSGTTVEIVLPLIKDQ